MVRHTFFDYPDKIMGLIFFFHFCTARRCTLAVRVSALKRFLHFLGVGLRSAVGVSDGV